MPAGISPIFDNVPTQPAAISDFFEVVPVIRGMTEVADGSSKNQIIKKLEVIIQF